MGVRRGVKGGSNGGGGCLGGVFDEPLVLLGPHTPRHLFTGGGEGRLCEIVGRFWRCCEDIVWEIMREVVWEIWEIGWGPTLAM